MSNRHPLLFTSDSVAANHHDAPCAEEHGTCPTAGPWTILIVDDDQDVHTLTRMVLRDLVFAGMGVTFLSAYSAAEAIPILAANPDIAVMLLDVVMETDQAGLDLVRQVRDTMHNRFVRIILRTGQAGQAPEPRVITEYDINDYRDKSDLTSQKLITAVTVALRAWRDLKTIEHLVTSLRRERESLARAQRIAHLGNWEWDILQDRMICSEEARRIAGHSEETDINGALATFLAITHPEDRDKVEQAIRKALSDHLPFEFDHRVTRPDGQVRWIHEMGEVVKDPNGKTLRVVGTMHDLTEQREAETRLKIAATVFEGAMEEAEARMLLTTKVFENAVEGVMVTDRKGVIHSINPAFSVITGYESEEALGKTPGILRSGIHDETFYSAIWNDILGEVGAWRGEIWNRRKNGEAHPVWETITTIRDRNNAIIHFVAVFQDLTAIKRSEEALLFRTYHDSLTGLPNRALFQDRLRQAIGQAGRTDDKVLVLIFDLDLFKNVNNSLGHTVGDRILKGVADRLRHFVREGDTVSRLGGDTFGFILREIRSSQDVGVVVRKLADALSKPFYVDDQELFVSASMGVTLYPDDGEDADLLIRNADMAVSRAKLAGRDTCHYYAPAMGAEAERRLLLEHDLRQGLERDEFLLFYQPKVELRTGRITGMEALVRWRHPRDGMVSPVEFIPVAEESGLILPLGARILKMACLQTRKWHDAGFAELKVAVNLSIRQFRQADLLKEVQTALEESGLHPNALELEVTETLMMENLDDIVAILTRLKAMGPSVAVDDFGVGHSSLTYLKKLPIDVLKIDQSFVRDLTLDSDDAAIVTAILALGRSLRLKVVAEGVETPDQLAFLRREGCDQFQGYLFSRPLETEAFTRLLQEAPRLDDP
ncbi:MAG: EAL domain-containing protein [Magnetococcales bacterium]|nr:EAL domain-containing protein [Magnetococcales bacterium]